MYCECFALGNFEGIKVNIVKIVYVQIAKIQFNSKNKEQQLLIKLYKEIQMFLILKQNRRKEVAYVRKQIV